MELLYGIIIVFSFFINFFIKNRHRKKFLKDNATCPRCGALMKETTTEKHLKKARIRGITHYGDIVTKQIAAQCPNCGYRIEYEN